MQGTPQITLDELLAQRGWMRALAQSLLRDGPGAEELVQEALLAALTRPPQQGAAPWLRSVVRNLAWKRRAKDRNRAQAEMGRASETIEASVPSSGELCERLELERLVVELLHGLEEPLRQVLYLRFFEGLEPKEIAARLGAPAGTVRWRLSTGLERLRGELDARHRGNRKAWAQALLPLAATHSLNTSAAAFAAARPTVTGISFAMKFALLALPSVAGLALWVNHRESTPPSVELSNATHLHAIADPSGAPAAPVQERSAAQREPLAVSSTELIPAALLEEAKRRIAAGWQDNRPEPIPAELLGELLAEWSANLLPWAESAGAHAAEVQNRIEAAQAISGIFGLLARIEEGLEPSPAELVRDRARWAPYFPAGGQGPQIDLRTALQEPERYFVDGATLTLPAGVFQVGELEPLFSRRIKDVTLAGAGMDRTLVVHEEFTSRLPINNLCFRDLTLHCDDNYLFDLRNEPASLHFQRVRVIGFDMGAGGSYMLSTKALALWADDSVFEGGFGKSRDGRLVRLGSYPTLMRLDRTHIDLINLDMTHLTDNSVFHAVGCRLTRLLDPQGQASLKQWADHSRGFGLSDCAVDFFPRMTADGSWAEVPSKDLNDHFPGWREQMRR